jgi:nucleotide-binding universal stress UspA family protein
VSGFRRFFIGTVVERLSRTLDCPMLVVKPAENNGGEQDIGFRSVVISCDVHGHWRRLTSLLALLQSDPTSPIHLVHAMEGPVNTLLDEPTASYGAVQQALQERLVHQYRQQARQLFPQTGQVSTVVAPGEPEEMVLRVAREQRADLIVVGVRPSGRMGRLISGSTTEALLRHAPCSVLTVPEPKDPEAAAGDL